MVLLLILVNNPRWYEIIRHTVLPHLLVTYTLHGERDDGLNHRMVHFQPDISPRSCIRTMVTQLQPHFILASYSLRLKSVREG